jgi:signal transduction histidine kinase
MIAAWARASYGGRTWREAGYALVGLPLAVAGFTCVVIPFAAGIGLAAVLAGVPVIGAALAVAHGFGEVERRRAGAMLGMRVERPFRPIRGAPAPGLAGWLRAGLGDAVAWRALLFAWLRLPIAALSFSVTVLVWAFGLVLLSYPAWFHVQAGALGDTVLDTGLSVLAVAGTGLVLLLLAPWLVRGAVLLDRLAVAGLLAPTKTSRRLVELESARSHAVNDAAQVLRRIERDLHDGAQARLVAVAMDLGVAKEILRSHPEAGQASELVDIAHTNASTAITELRDLARGIHPPALDHGLDTALATLASSTSIPVELRVDLPDRADPAIEATVYFCAAELLVNAVKHSHARRVALTVTRHGVGIRLQVRDDGTGGARVTDGGGLAGLADRAGTVDGRLSITSPPGGPTTVTIDLPIRA